MEPTLTVRFSLTLNFGKFDTFGERQPWTSRSQLEVRSENKFRTGDDQEANIRFPVPLL